MRIKRIVSIVLLLSISLFGVSAFSAEDAPENFSEPVSFLRAIEVLVDEDYSVQEQIDKKNAVAMVMRLIGQSRDAFGVSSALRDVEESDSDSGLLKAAVELGIAKLDENGRFNPNSMVSYADAATMIFTALGYHRAVDSAKSDSYFLKLASENKLNATVKIANYAKLSKGEWAQILYNAADIPIMQGISFGPVTKYKVSKDATALSEYLKIYQQEGTVTANSMTALRDKIGAGEDAIIVDGLRIRTKDTNIDEDFLLGKNVTAYYKESGTNNSLIYIEENQETKTLSLLDDEIVKFNFKDYVYSYNNAAQKTMEATVSKSAAVIYNGIAVTDNDFALLTQALFTPINGEVELIKSNTGSGYDIVKIKSYTTYVVDKVSKTEQLIFDKYEKPTLDVDPDKHEKVCISDTNGAALLISDLDEWDVLSVAVSDNEEYVQIVASGNAVKGYVTEIADDEISLEMEQFKLSHDLIDDQKRIPEIGTSTIAYLDHYGKVVAFQFLPSDEWRIGYLIKAQKENSLEDALHFKMLTQEGKIEYFESVYPLIADGKSYKSANDALNFLGEGGIIRYQLNSQGCIRRIDTPTLGERENAFSLQQRYAGNYKFKNYIPTFGGVIFPKSSAPVFTVPTGLNAKERDYMVQSLNNLVHDSTYDIVAYSIGDDDLTEDIILYKKPSTVTQSTREVMTIVTKITNAMDEDGMAVQKLYGMNAGGNREWTIYSDNPNTATLIADKAIKPGDIIRVTADNRMIVSGIQKVFDSAAKKLHTDVGGINPNTQYDSVFTVAYGKVLKRANGLIQVELYNDTKTIQKYKEGGLVFVCENGDKITKGSFDDIIPEVSSIVVDMNYSRIRTITIYK